MHHTVSLQDLIKDSCTAVPGTEVRLYYEYSTVLSMRTIDSTIDTVVPKVLVP